jgi:hypothetical protein
VENLAKQVWGSQPSRCGESSQAGVGKLAKQVWGS